MLWITAEEPDRDKGGGSIRQAHLLHAVATAFPTDLLMIGELRDEHLRRSLRRVTELGTPDPWKPPRRPTVRRTRELLIAIGGRATSDEIAERAARRQLARHLAGAGPHDVVMVEHAAMARLLPRRREGRWILTLHNIQSRRSKQRASLAPGSRQRWVWHRDAERARRLERWAVVAFDMVITVSEQDAKALPGESVVVPNGVDLEVFSASPLPARPWLVMTASLNFPPNADGARWFCERVLPIVRKTVPEVELTIAGRSPLPEVLALGELRGVKVVANPSSIVPHLEAARVAVVPLRIGSGTRLKALEAMASGRPLVGTTTGLEGLGIIDGVHARVTDDPGSMATAITDLLLDDESAGALASAAREHAERFSWDVSSELLVQAVRTLDSHGPLGEPLAVRTRNSSSRVRTAADE